MINDDTTWYRVISYAPLILPESNIRLSLATIIIGKFLDDLTQVKNVLFVVTNPIYDLFGLAWSLDGVLKFENISGK